ncbi:MAG: hypothetical protein AAF713_15790 [Pseudomonadota bacterium]
MENRAAAPQPGLMRPVYGALARVRNADGDRDGGTELRARQQCRYRRGYGSRSRHAHWFFASDFTFDLVTDYRPDIALTEPQSALVGGTRFELIPAPGSETPDARFVLMPDADLMFVGDSIMPFVGAPFVEEGNVDALIDAIEMVERLPPHRWLRGDEPPTANVPTPDRLVRLKPHLLWLRAETLAKVPCGRVPFRDQ